MNTIDWLVLYLVCFAANSLVSIQLLFRPWMQGRTFLALGGLALSLGSLVILSVDAINLLNTFPYRKLLPAAYFPLILVTLGCAWLCVKSLGGLARSGSVHAVKWFSAGCIISSVGLNVWCWQRIQSRVIADEFFMSESLPGTLVEATEVAGVTRLGSPIGLYRLRVETDDYSEFACAMKERTARVADPLIDMAEASKDYNCHGWVFTGGKYFLRGSDIPQILEDNCYCQTQQPKENDIIIYRSSLGIVVHTGLVRTVLSDGLVLIESKWGATGRYLHKPENQPYSQDFRYYRGKNSNHLIQIKERPQQSEEESTSEDKLF